MYTSFLKINVTLRQKVTKREFLSLNVATSVAAFDDEHTAHLVDAGPDAGCDCDRTQREVSHL